LKRRNSQSASDLSAKKKFKRFKNDSPPPGIILPTRFLLGGNIADPLNLSSFDGSRQSTPKSSPMPTPQYNKEVQVVLNANIHDPLNLTASPAQVPTTTTSSAKKKNRKRKRKRTDSEKSEEDKDKDKDKDESVEKKAEDASSTSTPSTLTTLSQKVTLHLSDVMKRHEREAIVSPVLPQDPPSYPSRYPYSHPHHRGFPRNNPLLIHFDEPNKKKNRRRKKVRLPPPTTASKDAKDGDGKDAQQKSKYKEKRRIFRYGNYSRYYGYRVSWKDNGVKKPEFEDARLKCFQEEWFRGKHVLDIGCNSGEVTIAVGRLFHPKSIKGIDIDNFLINLAHKNLARHLTPNQILSKEDAQSSSPDTFPENVNFCQENYVLDSDDKLESVVPEYDTILCLSVTKWIHLNWGDNGLKRFFKRILLHLRPGGQVILEPQSWTSYTKKHSITEETDRNYKEIRFKPDDFADYLTSEGGFASCQLIDTPLHESQGKFIW